MGDVEQAHPLPDGRVLGDHSGELQRHVPAGEVHQPGAESEVLAAEGGAPRHEARGLARRPGSPAPVTTLGGTSG